MSNPRETTITTTVRMVQRVSHTVNGNPIFRFLTDHGELFTKPDTGQCLNIDGADWRVNEPINEDAVLYLEDGKIWDWEK